VLVRTSLIYGGPEPGPQERFALEAADGLRDFTFFTDESRCPIAVADLAAAVLELSELEIAGPLHVAGTDALTRLEFARLICAHHGRDPAALRGQPGGPDRPKHVVLDCSRARALLRVRLRGAREVLSP
jgi:dTDP-4-dehydrorhamnose reductase